MKEKLNEIERLAKEGFGPSLETVLELVQSLREADAKIQELENHIGEHGCEIVQRTAQLTAANERIRELEENLDTAEKWHSEVQQSLKKESERRLGEAKEALGECGRYENREWVRCLGCQAALARIAGGGA